MKNNITLCLFLFFLFAYSRNLRANPEDTLNVNLIAYSLERDIANLSATYERKAKELTELLSQTEERLGAFVDETNVMEYINALNKKMALEEELTAVEEMYQLNMAKVRYRKGLELIKLMYEKILGLDHHFHSIQTYHNIVQLSNPNAYPEFQHTKKALERRLEKDNRVKLPNLLQGNPLLSASFSLLASVIGDGSARSKEKDLDKIACILDFTVQMHADLNLIYYETEFLKESNNNLKENSMKLFKDYAKIIGYRVDLDECRADDDWETVYEKLDEFIMELEGASMMQGDAGANRTLMKGIANLEFSIDRLLDFLEQYNTFIAQGGKYYQKFEVIVSNYPNEAACTGQLPAQFEILKNDIKFSINKFNEAYNTAELNGSKLKDLLYGIED